MPIAPRIVNCTFIDNWAYGTSVSHGGGGMYSEKADTRLSNCKFVDNSAENGGGAIYLRKGAVPVLIVNCTISNNSAAGLVDPGGGIKLAGVPGASAEINNSIVWGNIPDQIADVTVSSGRITPNATTCGSIDGGVAACRPLGHEKRLR